MADGAPARGGPHPFLTLFTVPPPHPLTVDEADTISLFMYSARYALASQNNRSRQTIDMV